MAQKKTSTPRPKCIALLTGGGDAPALNAVIRAVVKCARNRGWNVLGIEDGFEGLVQPGMIHPLDHKDVAGILNRGGTILGTTNRGNPFEYRMVVGGKEVVKDISDKVVDRIRDLGIDALIVIGGDGSLRIALGLYEKGIPVVGIPKTIDNDLSHTDITFGFDTAVNTATDALDKLHSTAEAHHRVMVVEVMGRYAGWIAVSAGIAGGADAILIPEIPFDIASVCHKIAERESQGRRFSIVVCAEGAKPKGGTMVIQSAKAKGRQEPLLGGIAGRVAEEIARLTGKETRTMVLGHLQRGGAPTTFDRILGTRFGAAAVRLVEQGEFGKMVGLRTPTTRAVPISEAVGVMKQVPLDWDVVRSARELGICFGD